MQTPKVKSNKNQKDFDRKQKESEEEKNEGRNSWSNQEGLAQVGGSQEETKREAKTAQVGSTILEK